MYDDNIFDLTIQLQNLFAEAGLLEEEFDWRKFQKLNGTKLKESTTLDDIQTYRCNISIYKDKLKYYSENYKNLDINNNHQTTDNFFKSTVVTMNSRAQKAVNVLIRSFKKFDTNSKDQLKLAIYELIDVTNTYIQICRDIVSNNPRLKHQRQLYGINYLFETYELYFLRKPILD